LAQAATLVAAAILCALVSNAFAARERHMNLVGYYPNATKVPPREETPAPVPPPATATQAPPTATIAPPPAIVTPKPATPVTQTTPAPATKPAATANPLAKFAPHEKQPYIEIAYNDVKTLHDHGALFLDARRTSVYEQGHIAGARPYSVWESDIDDKLSKLFNERQDPAQQALPIVVYCSGGDCEDSHMLAQKLYGAFFNNVYVYKDGFPDWQKHGAPSHTGAEP